MPTAPLPSSRHDHFGDDTVTSPTPLDRADARQRAGRTLVQSLAVDLALTLAVTIATALLPILTTAEAADFLTPALWIAVAAAVAKSGMVALVSWLARLNAAPPPPRGRHAS